MTQGWYYLHTNKELIYKNYPDAIADIRESDFCTSAWPWDGTPQSAWRILVEANALGANKDRIQELIPKWGCSNEDAFNYADYLGIDIGMDGNAHYARKKDFVNLQESPCGFGDSYLEAMSDLANQLGFKGGKLWNSDFQLLVKTSKTTSDL